MDSVETGCGCCTNSICGCWCHVQEEDNDGEYVYCHKCSATINIYEKPVWVFRDGILQYFACDDCKEKVNATKMV